VMEPTTVMELPQSRTRTRPTPRSRSGFNFFLNPGNNTAGAPAGAPAITSITAGAHASAPAITHYHRPVPTGGLWCAGSRVFWCAGNKPFASSDVNSHILHD
jgi:hypothetical protein